MRFSNLLAFVPLISASPLTKRALTTDDQTALQLARYLENLEYALYSGGYNGFTQQQYVQAGFPGGFRNNVGLIATHEMIHTDTLGKILSANGVSPVPPCTYKFPYSDPLSFVHLANMITTVGIGAYIGGTSLLVNHPELVIDAASILSVEARHDTYLRDGIKASPFPTPFDTALTASFAYSLAQAFIVSCPQQLNIPILPVLNLTAPAQTPDLQPLVPVQTILHFQWDPSQINPPIASGTPLYIAFINQNVTDVTYTKLTQTGSGTGTVPLPGNVYGVAFAVLTKASGGLTAMQLSASGTIAGPAEVVLS